MQTDTVPRINLNAHPTVLPSLVSKVFGEGLDRYRKYSVHQLPFDAFDRAGKECPRTVPRGLWFVQYLPGELGTAVHVAAQDEIHALDGHTFPTLRAAERALYDAGVLAFLVYEIDAAALGLPVGLQWSAHKTPAGTMCSWSHVPAPDWLAETMTIHTTAHIPITDDDRKCPADCPGSTVEPVTLDASDWKRCGGCRAVVNVINLNGENGLCWMCESRGTGRVSL